MCPVGMQLRVNVIISAVYRQNKAVQKLTGGKTEPCLGFHTATIVTYCTFDNVSVQRPLQAFSLEMVSYHISPHEHGFR